MSRTIEWTYYRLEKPDGTLLGEYNQADVREAVDRLADGKPWGWRSTPEGAEAVCEHQTIAVAWNIG